MTGIEVSKRSVKAFRRRLLAVMAIVAVSTAWSGSAAAWDGPGPLVIDHNCTNLSIIPPSWIESARANTRIYYGHTSHGEQITEGLRRIAASDSFYAYVVADGELPPDTSALRVNDDLRITPEYYCTTPGGMDLTRAYLNDNPETNISMFQWCVELNTWTAEQVEEYFDSMEALEAEFPHVTFIYTTGTAQYEGDHGHNRMQRNEQIRAYCTAGGKVLFDFADIDAWWYNSDTPGWEQGAYRYDTLTIPLEHPEYFGDDWGHTTFESCEVKGRAMWWMAAMLTGWSATSSGGEGGPLPAGRGLQARNFPNPFNPVTTIAFSLETAGRARLDIFDAAGRLVRTLVDGELPAARHEVDWNGMDAAGRPVSSGVYFYSVTAGGIRDTNKMILLR